MSDEWPFIGYPNEDYSNGDYSGTFQENMVVCVESYIGEKIDFRITSPNDLKLLPSTKQRHKL